MADWCDCADGAPRPAAMAGVSIARSDVTSSVSTSPADEQPGVIATLDDDASARPLPRRAHASRRRPPSASRARAPPRSGSARSPALRIRDAEGGARAQGTRRRRHGESRDAQTSAGVRPSAPATGRAGRRGRSPTRPHDAAPRRSASDDARGSQRRPVAARRDVERHSRGRARRGGLPGDASAPATHRRDSDGRRRRRPGPVASDAAAPVPHRKRVHRPERAPERLARPHRQSAAIRPASSAARQRTQQRPVSPGRPSDSSPARVADQASDTAADATRMAPAPSPGDHRDPSHAHAAGAPTGARRARRAGLSRRLTGAVGQQAQSAMMSRRLARLTSTSMMATTSSTPTTGAVSLMSRPKSGMSRSLGRSSSVGHDAFQPTHEQPAQHQDGHQAGGLDGGDPEQERAPLAGCQTRGARPSRSVARPRSAAHRSTALSSAHAETRMATRTATPVVSAASSARAHRSWPSCPTSLARLRNRMLNSTGLGMVRTGSVRSTRPPRAPKPTSPSSHRPGSAMTTEAAVPMTAPGPRPLSVRMPGATGPPRMGRIRRTRGRARRPPRRPARTPAAAPVPARSGASWSCGRDPSGRPS